MKRAVWTLCAVMCVAAQADSTNHVSGVVLEKAWERQAVMATPDGRLMDESGTIAESVFFEASRAYLAAIEENISGLTAGVTGQIARLESVLDNTPTNGFSIAIDMPLYWTSGAPKIYAAAEASDGTNDVLWLYFSRDLARAPHITARYEGIAATNDVPGEWLSWAGDNVTTNGYRGCKRCRFQRPPFARGATIRGYPHVAFGLPGVGFDFGNCVIKVGGAAGVTKEETGFYCVGDPFKRLSLENGLFKIEELPYEPD